MIGCTLKNFKINHKSQAYYYKDNNKIFLVISLLHINGFINDDSIKSLFKRLREGKLLRYVRTYHSNINNKWYNEESIYDIYNDILDDMTNPKSAKVLLRLERINKLRKVNGQEPKIYKTHLNFEETIKYLNLFLNKNRNYCIDHLFHEYIVPCINYCGYYNLSELNKTFDYDFSYLERSNTYSDTYCCDYCCGDYDSWYSYNSEKNREEIKKEITELISEFLNTKRNKFKGSYKKFVI